MHISIVPNVRLFVDIDGLALVPDGPSMREKPTLLLLHGGPGYDLSGFKPAFSRLADVVQIIYCDQRGHGRSDRRPREEWTLDTFADDVVRLCEALGITRPIVLGQSFGGFVAQRYLARHPGHAAKVILSSTSPRMTTSSATDTTTSCSPQPTMPIAASSSTKRSSTPQPAATAPGATSPKPRSTSCTASSSSRQRPAAGGAAGHRASVHAETNVRHRTRP